MAENPNFYAIIPANVRYAKIQPNAKLLYGEITALANKEGFCWATNQYFADLYSVNKSTISEWVSILHKNGFIDVEITQKIDGTPTRNIRIGIRQKAVGYTAKADGGYGGKAEHNNTSINNTSNRNKTLSQFSENIEKNPKTENPTQEIGGLTTTNQKHTGKPKSENQTLDTETSNTDLADFSEKFIEVFSEYSEMRKQKRSTLTQVSRSRILKKAQEYGEVRAIEVLNISIDNGWLWLGWDKKEKSSAKKEKLACETNRENPTF